MNNKNLNIKTVALFIGVTIAFVVFLIAAISNSDGDTAENSESSASAPLSGEYRPPLSESSLEILEDSGNNSGESNVFQSGGADLENSTYSANSNETDIDSEEDGVDDTESETVSDSEITIDDGNSNAEYIEYVFRNNKLLEQHYQKHGIEMGFNSAEEYERAACDVANSPDALHKTEAEDGDDVYYIAATNEFVIISTDGYIRTYFNPNQGIDYFNRQ